MPLPATTFIFTLLVLFYITLRTLFTQLHLTMHFTIRLMDLKLDLGVAEFWSTRRRNNKSRLLPEKNSSKSEIHFTSEVTPDFSKSIFFLLLAF